MSVLDGIFGVVGQGLGSVVNGLNQIPINYQNEQKLQIAARYNQGQLGLANLQQSVGLKKTEIYGKVAMVVGVAFAVAFLLKGK